MRVKKRKGAEAILAAHKDLVLTEPANWLESFGNQNSIHIEVGCGKGDFVLGMAARHPEINYVAIDLQSTVISYALDKLLASNLSNVRLLLADGRSLAEYFLPHQVELLYLNFSDPWPKSRHEKRRLTYKDFLQLYEAILIENGEIHFKTDNRSLFEYSLVSMSQYGMIFKQIWLDLHKDLEFAEQNVLTEYERKWADKGPIYRMEAQFVQKNESDL
ncbi:MAG: tRNA (guanosine(46)-N7)-methyltransferase TrmB [Streptococcaceae bacterium]|jgi:tRNA (guanine-N7-)-methyltransferase|nr:tRNA (guanosine(46)-N7)-methyltransferase TrmB [Streptococcaceae bacterium]